MSGASDFKFGALLRSVEAHHKFSRRRNHWRGPGLGEFPKICGFPVTMAESSDLKFGTQLGLANVHHKITPIGKMGMATG